MPQFCFHKGDAAAVFSVRAARAGRRDCGFTTAATGLKRSVTLEAISMPRSGELAFAGNFQFTEAKMAAVARPPLRYRGFERVSAICLMRMGWLRGKA